jgi:phosphoribosylanthranilate isomerase
VFVKICGLTTPAAIEAAIYGGADAVGFVFAESPRRVTPAAARELCRNLPAEIVRVAVMRHPSAADWQEVHSEFRPDWLQTDAADFGALQIGPDCVRLPVFRDARIPAESSWPAPMLFESIDSGAGRRADWQIGAQLAAQTDLILAGGLDPTNIAEAIAAVAPWGVDVSSGVESSRGTKDPDMIIDFIARARAAERH